MSKLRIFSGSFIADKLNGQVFKTHWLPYAMGCLIEYSRVDPAISSQYEFHEPAFIPYPVSHYEEILAQTDIMALTNYVWNQKYNNAIAQKFKQINPKGIVVYGGASIPEDKIEAQKYAEAHPYVDLFFVGPGERNFKSFLLNFKGPISAHEGSFGIGWSNVSVNKDLYAIPAEAIPNPYTGGLFDAIVERTEGKNVGVIFETTRGCPFKCSFCDWGGLSRSIVHRRDVEPVYRTIDWIYKHADKIQFVDIIDANFGMVERDLDILKYFKKKMDETGKHIEISVNGFVKNGSKYLKEVIMLLRHFSSHPKNVAISFQTHSKETLKVIDRENIKNDRFYSIASELQQEGLFVISEMILGLPGETPESWLETLQTDFELGMASMRAYPLIMIVNTPMYSADYRAKHGLKIKKAWLPHDMFLTKQAYLDNPNATTECDFTDESFYEEVELLYECNSYTNEQFVQIMKYWWWYQNMFNLRTIPADIIREKNMRLSDQIKEFFQLMDDDKMPTIKTIYDRYEATIREIFAPEPLTKVQSANAINFLQKGMRIWEAKFFIDNREAVTAELHQMYPTLDSSKWKRKTALYIGDEIS